MSFNQSGIKLKVSGLILLIFTARSVSTNQFFCFSACDGWQIIVVGSLKSIPTRFKEQAKVNEKSFWGDILIHANDKSEEEMVFFSS